MATYDDVSKMKEVRKDVEVMVKENFGYCPDNNYFNKMMEKLDKYETIVEHDWPKEWEEYHNKYF